AALRCTWATFEPLEELPPVYANGQWPGDWPRELDDFYTDSAVAAFFWADHENVWQEAAGELRRIFRNNALASFLGRLRGEPLSHNVVVVPNLVYPALETLVAATQDNLYLILPPPRAVGESPPWPYREDAGWVLAESCRKLSDFLLADTLVHLDAGRVALLRHAAVTLFLETAGGEEEALAYLVRSKKQHQLPQLPATVETLRHYLHQPGGKKLREVLRTSVT
ncbi:MAG: hypothetical protein L0322_23020, partial [Chloroflexi bacterium]|nr:hypothetical protein [Chloroflexota bacterium]